jgi:hypothetical protein
MPESDMDSGHTQGRMGLGTDDRMGSFFATILVDSRYSGLSITWETRQLGCGLREQTRRQHHAILPWSQCRCRCQVPMRKGNNDANLPLVDTAHMINTIPTSHV